MELYTTEHFEKVLKERVEYLGIIGDNSQHQFDEMKMCSDPVDGILYWFDNYAFTDKNKNLFGPEVPDVLPFILFDFQREAVKEIWASIWDGTKKLEFRQELTNAFIEKSRQMGLSWVIMGIFVYGFVFHNHKYHCISQKESDVDKTGDMRSLFEKARFMLNNLPHWMKPEGYTDSVGSEYNKKLLIGRKDGTGSLTGESAQPDASRSGTYNAVFMDEMGFMANARTINTAAASATPCRIFNSTPNGEGNEFYRMRKLCFRRQIGDLSWVPPEVKGLRYHWSEHPLYDDNWYKWKTKGMSREKIAQELEINYNVAIVGRVYPDFPTEYDPEVKYDPEKPMYIWIDNSHGGADPHAILLMQPNGLYWDIFDCMEFNCSVDDMADIARNEPRVQLSDAQLAFLDRYKGYGRQRAVFISDPFDTHSTVNKGTIYQIYKQRNIYLRVPNERSQETQIMHTKANLHRIRYGINCQDYASAMMNARYPDRPDNSKAVTKANKPIHDWTSHYRTATEYGVNYMLENPLMKEPKQVQERLERDPVTRRLKTPTSSKVKKDQRIRRHPVTRKLMR